MLSLQNSNRVVSKRFVCVWENVIFNKTSPSCSIASGDCIHKKHSLKKNRCGWILVGCILLRTDQYILQKCVKPENGEVTNTGSEGNGFIFKNFQKNDDILLPDSNKHNISKAADLDIDHLCRYQGILLFAHSIVGWRSQPETSNLPRQCRLPNFGSAFMPAFSHLALKVSMVYISSVKEICECFAEVFRPKALEVRHRFVGDIQAIGTLICTEVLLVELLCEIVTIEENHLTLHTKKKRRGLLQMFKKIHDSFH